MLGRTLLIIDDDKRWSGLTAKYFSLEQYDVHTAVTCAEGIRLAEALRPDYILLDYHLEDGNAVTVSSHIRSSENLKKTLILIISGDATRRESAYAECQADHFIVKCTPYKTIDDIMRGLKRRVHWDCGVVERGDIRLEKINFQVSRASRPLLRLLPEQFKFFALLVDKSPCFVHENEIAKYVLDSDSAQEKKDIIRGIAQRLRKNIGPQLGRRIKNKASRGWIYVQPRVRS